MQESVAQQASELFTQIAALRQTIGAAQAAINAGLLLISPANAVDAAGGGHTLPFPTLTADETRTVLGTFVTVMQGRLDLLNAQLGAL